MTFPRRSSSFMPLKPSPGATFTSSDCEGATVKVVGPDDPRRPRLSTAVRPEPVPAGRKKGGIDVELVRLGRVGAERAAVERERHGDDAARSAHVPRSEDRRLREAARAEVARRPAAATARRSRAAALDDEEQPAATASSGQRAASRVRLGSRDGSYKEMVDRVDGLVRYATPALPPDQPVETGRYLDALRRSKLLIALIVVAACGRRVVRLAAAPEDVPGDREDRPRERLRSPPDPRRRLRPASPRHDRRTADDSRYARPCGEESLPGETAATLDDKVASSVDPKADIVDIVATDDTADGAAQIANTVATTFLAQQTAASRNG